MGKQIEQAGLCPAMIEGPQARNYDRLKAALGTAGLQLVFSYALMRAFAVGIPSQVNDSLKLINLTLAPLSTPTPRTKPQRTQNKKTEGAASPPNLKSKPTLIAVPPPVVQLVAPSPVVVAPTPGSSNAPSTGASDIRGPGTGSGGLGIGKGSGGKGNGNGGGDEIPPRWIKGHLKDSDYPSKALEAGIGGIVSVRFTVGTDGRVSRCLVTQSSGNTDLDETTCRLITQRLRYEPARDAGGRAVSADVEEEHEWITHERGRAAP